jgi:hypothetical protein
VIYFGRTNFHIAPRKLTKVIVSREPSSCKHGKGGGGFRETGYDLSVVCASQYRCKRPLISSTPEVYSTTQPDGPGKAEHQEMRIAVD